MSAKIAIVTNPEDGYGPRTTEIMLENPYEVREAVMCLTALATYELVKEGEHGYPFVDKRMCPGVIGITCHCWTVFFFVRSERDQSLETLQGWWQTHMKEASLGEIGEIITQFDKDVYAALGRILAG